MQKDILADEVSSSVLQQLGRYTPKSEYDSWRNSSQYVQHALASKEIPETCGVAIEYQIPSTSKRIDYLISGLKDSGETNVVIVELKQWSEVEATQMDATVRTFVGGRVRPMTHPSYQVWSYARLLSDFNEHVEKSGIGLHPCAYLHNYKKSQPDLTAPVYAEHIKRAPLFCKGEAEKLSGFIESRIHTGDQGQSLVEIDQSKTRPSKSLVNALGSMLKGNQEFVLIDEQKIAVESILDRAKNNKARKTVLIIKGGPGTGKSVVAINALVKALEQGKLAQYVTKNSAPREVFQAKLAGTMRKTRIANLFKSSGSYYEVDKNSFDLLLVDEAHRLNEKSGLFKNKGANQTKELINAAITSAFFIDEAQRVTIHDAGSIDEIRKWAGFYDAEIIELDLPSQFRCSGSDGYVAWIDNLLGIRETANQTFEGANFDFRVFDDPNTLYEKIKSINASGEEARLLTGICWKWQTKKDPFAYDIELPKHHFKIRWNDWNLGQGWILHPESIDQAGCIHTSQGLELPYVGVILGPDIRLEDGKIVTDISTHPSDDTAVRGYKKRMKEDPDSTKELMDSIIRNTYRTLMTRGMKGCYVFAVDIQLNELLKKRSGMALYYP